MRAQISADTGGALESPRALEVHEFSKAFVKDGQVLPAVENVNLAVKHGEFVSLVGPSGCGKSTLLRAIAGLTKASAGTVRVDGREVRTPRRDVGLMLQQPALLPWRTVVSNVLLPLELQRRLTDEDRDKATTLLSLAGLKEFPTHYPNELSGGMEQRASLVRVLINDPWLMLLDEPFGALDEFTREVLNQELASLVQRLNCSVVLVTHSIQEAVFLADRVVAMTGQPGRIAGQVSVPFDRPRSVSLMRQPEFVALVHEVRALFGLQ